jgi:hypothetical protein
MLIGFDMAVQRSGYGFAMACYWLGFGFAIWLALPWLWNRPARACFLNHI